MPKGTRRRRLKILNFVEQLPSQTDQIDFKYFKYLGRKRLLTLVLVKETNSFELLTLTVLL